MTLSISNLVQQARKQLEELTCLELASTVSVRKDKSGWRVQVEAVEKRSIPDSQDILSTYELTVDEDANVLNFTRVGMRKRSEVRDAALADIEV